jgi:hypothetical protein
MLGSHEPGGRYDAASGRSFASDSPWTPPPRPGLAAPPDQDVSRFFYRWGGHLASCLARVRVRFQGDLDQYLIYLNFILAELSQLVSRADAAARGEEPPEWTLRGMNALSLAEITGVPRETTRRKLQHLVEAGYLRRGADGLFYLGGKYGLDAFFTDLRPLFWDGLLPAEA